MSSRAPTYRSQGSSAEPSGRAITILNGSGVSSAASVAPAGKAGQNAGRHYERVASHCRDAKLGATRILVWPRTDVNLKKLLRGEVKNCHRVLGTVAGLCIQPPHGCPRPRRMIKLAGPFLVPPALELHHLGNFPPPKPAPKSRQ